MDTSEHHGRTTAENVFLKKNFFNKYWHIKYGEADYNKQVVLKLSVKKVQAGSVRQRTRMLTECNSRTEGHRKVWNNSTSKRGDF